MPSRFTRTGAPLLALIALLTALLSACQGEPPVPATPVPAPTGTALPPRPRVDYTAVPESVIAPVVIARSPARGEELRPDGAIQLVFDRPMDQRAAAAAFSLAPATPGSVEWPDARTLLFRPAAPLPRNSVFDVLLGQGAQAQDGAQLNGAYQFRVATAGFLEAAQVIPAPGTADAQAGSAVTVIFNRPVVPLVSVGQQANLPQPLRLEPAVPGKGQWLNTSVYVFRPDQPLQGGTTYTGRVDGALVDTAGNPLEREFTWQFSVAAPQVINVQPADGADHVSVEPTLRVQFNQQLDAAIGPGAISLTSGSDTVTGRVQVLGDTLLFTPSQRLQFGTRYTAQVNAGVGGPSGGAGLAQPYAWSFTTVPLPELLSTVPADGDSNARPYGDITLQFNTVMDVESIWRSIQVTPALPATAVYSYFNEYDYSFHLGGGFKPSTNYELRIGPGVSDPYGNIVADERTIRFSTGPLDPGVQLLAPDPAGTYAASQPARVVLSSVNAARADLALFRLDPRQIGTYTDWRTSPPPAQSLLRQWNVTLDAPLDQNVSTRIDLAENGGALAPGAYLLQLDYPNAQYTRYHVMVVSDVNLTLKAGPTEALAWANNLRDGQPIADLPLTFYGDEQQVLGTATTDAGGVARLQIANPNKGSAFVVGGCASAEASCATFAAASRYWGGGYAAGSQGIPQGYDTPGLSAYVYTDRPIYRPGQQVEFKGIVRRDDDARYSLPSGVQTAQVTISAPDGSQVYQQDAQLSQLGTFADTLTLAPGAALGQYSIGVQAGDRGFSFAFTVSAYRPPEFEVNVATPAPTIVRGSAATADVNVSYFFGGPVANVPVQWNVLAEPYRFSPPALGGYTFGSTDDPWRCFECWWQPPVPPMPILSGSGTTDGQGRLQISLPPDLKDAQGNVISDSVRLIVEATASGNDNQAISGRAELVVHKGDLYIGLAPRAYVATAGQEQQVDVVAVDTEGKRLAGRTVSVDVQRYEYSNTFVAGPGGVGGSWQARETRKSVFSQTLTTDSQGAAVLRFTPPNGGSYRVVAAATDGGGRTVETSTFLWVAGKEFVPWRRDNDDRLTLISDRTSYKPGETAAILIPSPFSGPTWALISIERGGILKHEVVQLQSNSTVYQLPIVAEHAPNIFFSVALFTGSASSPNKQTPTADYKLGYLPLQVEPVPQTLNVTLTPDKANAQPGDSVTYAVQATDAAGAPVAAELSLDLVDKAVLSLLPRQKDAIVGAFYGQRGLSVQTSTGLSVSANRLLAQLEQQLAGQLKGQGDTATGAAGGDGGAAPQGTSAPAAASEPQRAGDAAESRADGDQAQQPPAVRSQFADTAFWQPTFATDAAGRGSVTVKLPDNLTTWVLRGVALTGDTRVGEATVEVLSTKPLLVRPVAPRFLVVGDTVELAANVSNNTDAALDVDVALETKGITLTGSLSQRLLVPARGEAQATWSALVGDAPQADLVFSAQGGGYSDAARPRLATGPEGTLPIYRYSVPETVGTGGQLTTAGSRTEVVALPPDLDDSRGELTLRLDPSLAAGMRDGLAYLEHYEYECTEQTVSRFLPNVLTAKALRDLGIANPELEARLPALVKEGIDKLALRQREDGGWGWWSDDESNLHISAYVVLGLLKAKQAGYDVNDTMLARGVNFLQGRLTEVDVKASAAEANEQAFVLYVLSEQPQSTAPAPALQSLLTLREKLSVYARALLAMAIHANNTADPAIKTLLADLNTSAITSATGAHWEENERDYWAMNTDTRTTAIVLQALTRLDAQNQINPNVVRWLMVARRSGVWETTQETAWALMALTEWMQQTGELKGDYDYAAWLNDAERTSGHFASATLGEPVVQRVAIEDLLRDAGNRLTVGRGEGPGVLYYTAHLNAYLPVEKVQALDRGVIVQRRYTLASCTDGPDCPEVTQAKLGDVIRVDITLIAPNDLYYLRLEDPLPAGAEAVDTGLATTSLLAQGPGLERPDEGRWGWWWRWYSRSELRDEKVALFADYLAKGSYEYSYTMRATLPGVYHVIPTTASEFYFPEVYGRSDGRVLTIGR